MRRKPRASAAALAIASQLARRLINLSSYRRRQRGRGASQPVNYTVRGTWLDVGADVITGKQGLAIVSREVTLLPPERCSPGAGRAAL